MLNNHRGTNFSTPRSKTVILTGGINENITNLEMSPGELIAAENYTEVDGVSNGYTSARGYERFDGQPSPSSIELVKDADGVVTSDVDREAARTAIQPVPGTGDVRGVHIFDTNVYAFRDSVALTSTNMYKATPTGWSLITGTSMDAGGKLEAINYRFSTFAANVKHMFWVDGVSIPHYFDGTTVGTITTGVAGSFPTHIGAWKNRLFLAYPGGHLMFSAVGDPTDWTTTSVTGEIFVGEDIESISVAPGGALVIFTKNFIKVLYYESNTADFIFRLDDFSTTSGAIAGTVQRMLGTLYFADDRGVTTMENVDAFGDFAESSLSKKVQKTFQANKSTISASIVDRAYNQYILFFTTNINGYLGIVFTFTQTERGRRLKGATFLKYAHQVLCTAEGKNDERSTDIYFGSTGGYIYKMNEGTTFDGEPIRTHFTTAFYHYNTPRNWKRFKRLTFEISAEKYTEFNFKEEYSYRSPQLPTTNTETATVSDTGGIYGTDVWGSFLWGGAYVAQLSVLILGYGINMNTSIRTEEKYKRPHTVHNVIVDYTVGSTQI